jgi:hypothetical protein
MPIFLASWEVEIYWIVVGGQPREKVYETPYQPIAGCNEMCLLFQCSSEAKMRRIMASTQSRQKSL